MNAISRSTACSIHEEGTHTHQWLAFFRHAAARPYGPLLHQKSYIQNANKFEHKLAIYRLQNPTTILKQANCDGAQATSQVLKGKARGRANKSVIFLKSHFSEK